MNKLHLLKPEEAARRASKHVKDWQAEQARKAADAKRKPPAPAARKPAVETPNAAPLPTNKEELNAQLFEREGEGDKDGIERLLKAGADANARDSSGMTVLMKAAYNGNTEVAELLIAHFADVDLNDNAEHTALMFAASHGNSEIAKLLIDANVNVNPRNVDGVTALMMASWNGHKEIVQLLIDAKVDLNAATSNLRKTAITEASEKGHVDIVELLRKHGAKE